MMKQITIQFLTATHWPDAARIYEAGIATGNATFQTEAPSWEAWDKAHRKDCRLVAICEGKVAGWAALSSVSSRPVYAGVAEVSIYVDSVFRGQGVGDILMHALIKESEARGVWTLQSGVFPENAASMRLHQKHGFRTIGLKERIGKMNFVWRDVAMLERRSQVVGID
jgi:Sortase and related acyltransferases